ncbi:GNAT family N-acetyltransferase [Halomonas aquamarina]|uniref:GNAT family N-acetyltransferase n=1 Tax=Vreelandella aquamarina TaxID=77097 RepID=A0ACC5VWX3_9GAMM|nr:GNAT family N-acetyltransferase [Halomonas aquamarina]MBZ5488370.1 GNAT family N-acetyltransferase [Halomonas aquamarina]
MYICETQRLILRELTLNDTAELTRILGDPAVMKYSIRGVCDDAMTRRFIEWCLTCYEAHGIGPWALIEKDTNTLIGFCGVSPEEVNGIEEIGLGYRLATRYWNRGLAPEAARAVLQHAFGKKRVSSVVVLIEPDHVASQRVALKAGFEQFDVHEFHGREVRMYRQSLAQWEEHHADGVSGMTR